MNPPPLVFTLAIARSFYWAAAASDWGSGLSILFCFHKPCWSPGKSFCVHNMVWIHDSHCEGSVLSNRLTVSSLGKFLGGFSLVICVCESVLSMPGGGTVPLCAEWGWSSEAAVQLQVFDVRSEASCLGVWAGAGTDGGRVWWSDYSPCCSPVCPGMNAPLHPP